MQGTRFFEVVSRMKTRWPPRSDANDEGYAGPERLPTDVTLRRLLDLVAPLERVTH